MRVNGLGLTLHVNVNPTMKFIYMPCKCKRIICIYICVIVNIAYKMCKCKNKYIYIILHNPIKQYKCENTNIYMILHGYVKQCKYITM